MRTQTTKIITALIFLVILLANITALTITNVNSVPKEIAPGETAKVELKIENEIGKNLKNVVVSLDLSEVPFAPYQSSTKKSIGELDDGDDKKITFNLIALSNAEAGTYKIPVIITYIINETETEPVVERSFIGLTINAKSELKLSTETNLIKGMTNEISIEITNMGLTGVKFLNVGIKENAGIKIIGSKEIYIGDIESDDFDNADFKLFISQSASSLINLPVELTYRDATNKLQRETIILPLKTYTTNEAIELGLIKKNNTLIYAGAIIFLIVVWFIYRRIRKRRKKKRQEV